MKKLLILLLVLAGFMACENESIYELSQDNSKMNQKVDVCHKGKIINVSVNSLSGHQGHGDAVDMDGDGYFDIENECSDVDCDDNTYSEENSCYPFTCGDELDFVDLELEFSGYCSFYENNNQCGVFPVSNINFYWTDIEGISYSFNLFAYDLTLYTCDDNSIFDDFYIGVVFDSYNSTTNEGFQCIELYGRPGNDGIWNIGEGTEELYNWAVGYINNLASTLGIADECADDFGKSSNADSAKQMQSLPVEFQNILEERKALLPFNK